MRRSDFIRLAEELKAEDEKAADLWTRLPSYKAAQRSHGDYACELRPPISDLLEEVTLYVSHKCAPTPEQVAEAGTFYRCPCGECPEA